MYTGSVFCVSLMVMLDICFAIKTYLNKGRIRRAYIYVLIASTLYLFINSFYDYYISHLGVNSVTKARIFYTISIEVLICLFNVLYNYFADIFDIQGRFRRNMSTGIAYTLFLIAVPFLSVETQYTTNGVYLLGPKTIASVAAWALFLVLVVLLAVFNEKSLRIYNLGSIFFTVVVFAIFLFLEFLFPAAQPINLGVVAFNMMLFIIVENPDVTRIEKEEDINKSKTQFISTMSHEIRTPMNVICGMIEILKRSDFPEEQAKYLDNIEKSAESLLLIINDILDYNKINEGKMELVNAPYSLRDCLDDIYLMMNIRIGSSPVDLLFNVDDDVTDTLIGDENKLRQIIINLVNNAIKFTDKGCISLSVKRIDEIENRIHLKFAVADTGQGIKESDLQKLFTAFGQVDREKNKNKESTGLGLSICKELVELMGGTISLESTYEVGTTFYFDIFQQLCGENDVIPDKKKNMRAFKAPSLQMLVVDDNHMNLEVFKGIAEPLDAAIDTTDNGNSAITMANQKKYDIMFIDRMMPTLSGEETVREIRLTNPEVSIIALTADLTNEGKKSMLKAGADDFMPKPFNTLMLNELIIKYVAMDKIEYLDDDVQGDVESQIDENEIQKYADIGIDLNKGIENCGSKKLFDKRISDFADMVTPEAEEAQNALTEKDIEFYTIKVHAIKSCCYLVGNKELGDMFLNLEMLGKANDVEGIKKNTKDAFDKLSSFTKKLQGEDDVAPKEIWPAEKMAGYLGELREFVECGDIVTADKIVRELVKCNFDVMQDKFDELRKQIVNFDTDNCAKLIDEIVSNLGK